MIQECVMATVITALVLVGIVRILAFGSRQRYLSEQRLAARYLAANLMEDAMSCAWPELTTQARMQAVQPPGSAGPASGAQVAIAVEEEAEGVRRIRITVTGAGAASHLPLASLVAWRYHGEEPEQ